MGRSKRHGRRPHKVRDACTVKGSAFTTWDAAMSVVATTPGAVRPYRGSCCGYFHITRETVDEYAQRVAQFTPPRQVNETWADDTLGNEAESVEADDEVGSEPRVREGDAGDPEVRRGRVTRLAPSPTALARRLQAHRDSEKSR